MANLVIWPQAGGAGATHPPLLDPPTHQPNPPLKRKPACPIRPPVPFPFHVLQKALVSETLWARKLDEVVERVPAVKQLVPTGAGTQWKVNLIRALFAAVAVYHHVEKAGSRMAQVVFREQVDKYERFGWMSYGEILRAFCQSCQVKQTGEDNRWELKFFEVDCFIGEMHVKENLGEPQPQVCMGLWDAVCPKGGGGSMGRYVMRVSHTPPTFSAAGFLHHLKHDIFCHMAVHGDSYSYRDGRNFDQDGPISTKMTPCWRDKNLCGHDRQMRRHSCSHLCGHQQ